MSSRRKGKPQQRIHLESVEAENDLLTCGKCQQEFYLCDINSFIKHKISLCSKNSLHCHSPPPRNHDDQPPPVTTPTKPPDGDQLPIHKEHKEQKVPGLNFQALFSSKDSLEKIIRDELARTGNSHSKKKEVEKVDAETITVYSEPSLFTCSTCKSVYSSSWFLIQHVQKSHGLCIYVESSKDADGADRVNGRVADLVVEDTSSPASQPTDCPQSPVISNKSELFSPPSAPFQRSSTALSTMPWKPYSRPVQNSELLHSDLMSRLATSLPFRPTDVTLQDIYSQRLRQLAGQPNASTSPPSVNSPVTKKPPSLGNSEAPSAFSAPSVKGAKNSAAANEGDKGYTCPICNKQFRFKVTLMAHQRNHTGEKPFRCPLCVQAFSLASKLKRHLVHKHKFSTLANLDSNTRDSTPECKDEEAMDVSDEEAEPPDTQEFVLQETQAEAELIMASHQELAESLANSTSMDPSMRDNTASVLSEVMKGSGMDKIPQYKEAFEAALDEMSDNDERSDESNSVNQEPMDSASEMTETSVKEESRDSTNTPNRRPSSQSRDNSPIPTKLIKVEAQGEDNKPLSSLYNNLDPALYPSEIRNAATMAAVAQVGMYPSIWFQPSNPRDFLPFQPRGSIFATTRENGLATTTTQSALKVSQSSKVTAAAPDGGSTPSKSPTSGAVSGQQAAMRRRNDTCEYCGKIFKNCSNLTVHRRSHTGEKPYKCQLCSYACAQSSKLTRHMRTHGRTGKDVYKCKFCDMPFSVPSTLEKHMRKCMENHPSMSTNASPVSLSKALEAQSQVGNTSVSLLGNLSLTKALDIGVTSAGLSSLGFSKSLVDGVPYNGLDLSKSLDIEVTSSGKTLDVESIDKSDTTSYNGLDLSKGLGVPTIPKEEEVDEDEESYSGMDLTKTPDNSGGLLNANRVEGEYHGLNLTKVTGGSPGSRSGESGKEEGGGGGGPPNGDIGDIQESDNSNG